MKFRKRPVVIEAVQWTGENPIEILDFCSTAFLRLSQEMRIPTLEGVMSALPGDWIIKGVKGEFYPCKPNIFVLTYEREEKQGGKMTDQFCKITGQWVPDRSDASGGLCNCTLCLRDKCIEELEAALREIQDHCESNWLSPSVIIQICRKILKVSDD